MDKKITKRDNFVALREIVVDTVASVEMQERLLTFIDHELEQLEKRAASARKYAKKASKSADELADAVYAQLTDGAQHDIPSILNALADTELGATSQKITYRLSKMVEAGTVVRDTISVKDEGKSARKVCVYALAPDESVEE